MAFGSSIQAPSRIPAGATAEGDGIVLGNGPVTLDAYIDFLCPFCKRFEERSGPVLDRFVADGVISLVCHPMGFLDRLSTTAYSSRAASASGCASDQGQFLEYAKALFVNQPPEGGPGLSDDQLAELGHATGIDDPGFDRCVLADAYVPWAAYVTARAAERGVSGTPSVFVNGVPVPAQPSTIIGVVQEVAAAA
jgi:protein-disulfide isomerase